MKKIFVALLVAVVSMIPTAAQASPAAPIPVTCDLSVPKPFASNGFVADGEASLYCHFTGSSAKAWVDHMELSVCITDLNYKSEAECAYGQNWDSQQILVFSPPLYCFNTHSYRMSASANATDFWGNYASKFKLSSSTKLKCKR